MTKFVEGKIIGHDLLTHILSTHNYKKSTIHNEMDLDVSKSENWRTLKISLWAGAFHAFAQ